MLCLWLYVCMTDQNAREHHVAAGTCFIEMRPDISTRDWRNLGNVKREMAKISDNIYDMNNLFNEAIRYFEDSLRLHPNHSKVRINIYDI